MYGYYISLSIGSNFFLYLFENKAVFNIVNLCLQNKVRHQIFPPPLLLLLDPGSEIRDLGWLKMRIRGKCFFLVLFKGTFKSFFKDKKSKRSHKTVGVRLPTSLFYIERDPRSRTEIGERDTQVIHVNEATAV
jgi:hypothetical protein